MGAINWKKVLLITVVLSSALYLLFCLLLNKWIFFSDSPSSKKIEKTVPSQKPIKAEVKADLKKLNKAVAKTVDSLVYYKNDAKKKSMQLDSALNLSSRQSGIIDSLQKSKANPCITPVTKTTVVVQKDTTSNSEDEKFNAAVAKALKNIMAKKKTSKVHCKKTWHFPSQSNGRPTY